MLPGYLSACNELKDAKRFRAHCDSHCAPFQLQAVPCRCRLVGHDLVFIRHCWWTFDHVDQGYGKFVAGVVSYGFPVSAYLRCGVAVCIKSDSLVDPFRLGNDASGEVAIKIYRDTVCFTYGHCLDDGTTIVDQGEFRGQAYNDDRELFNGDNFRYLVSPFLYRYLERLYIKECGGFFLSVPNGRSFLGDYEVFSRHHRRVLFPFFLLCEREFRLECFFRYCPYFVQWDVLLGRRVEASAGSSRGTSDRAPNGNVPTFLHCTRVRPTARRLCLLVNSALRPTVPFRHVNRGEVARHFFLRSVYFFPLTRSPCMVQ